MELLPQAAVVLDGGGRLIRQNRLANAAFGGPAADDDSAVASALAEVGAFRTWLDAGSAEVFRCPLRVYRGNGVPVTVEVSARRIEGSDSVLCLVHEPARELVAFRAQRYFDVAFDAAPIGMALFNTDGEYVRVNSALCAFLGRSEDDLLGRRDQELTHPDDRPADVDAAWRILRGELSTWQCEKRFLRPDGSVVWAIANLTFLRDADGNPMSWMGQFQDVTQRKESEELMERQRRQLAEAQSLARLGRWEWDLSTDRIEFSDELCRIYGIEPGGGPLTFQAVLERTHPDDRRLVQEMVESAYATGEPFEFEHRIVQPDGTVRVNYGRGEVVLDDDGNPIGMFGTGQDITDLKQAYLALEASERQTRQILESAHDPFVSMDENGRIIDWNPAAEALFGWTRDEVLGRELSATILPVREREAHRASLQGLVDTGTTKVVGPRLETAVTHRDGHEVPVDFTLSAIRGPGGYTFNAFFRDRTPQIEAEAAISAARDSAIEASRLKSNFLANMSHEIRTPMNAVIGMTELLLDSELSDSQRKYASTVRIASEALLEIINDILDFSKIEAGKFRLEPREFQFRKLVEEVGLIVRTAAEVKGLRLSTFVDESCPEVVVGDPGRLRQILINLLGNAVKFTPGGGVTLRAMPDGVSPAGSLVRFEIVDTGVGIPEEAQEELFQAFYQVDSSLTRAHGGTGLGLVISKQLVDLMEGEIGVKSRVGEGSTFWFSVPFQPATGAARTNPEAEELYPVAAGAAVLVAEDNEVNQLVAVSMLTKLGYRSHVVASGGEAIEALSEDDYAAVLMDCQMPGMDGFDATREIRRREGNRRRTPVIAMTAGAMNGDRERCLSAGMDDYITKPVRIEELGRVLQRWSGRRPPRSRGVIGSRTGRR